MVLKTMIISIVFIQSFLGLGMVSESNKLEERKSYVKEIGSKDKFVELKEKENRIYGESSVQKEGDFEFENGVITKYLGKDEHVVIPDVLGGQKVTEIGRYAFQYNDYILSVKVPKGVKVIGFQAFYNCDNLMSVQLPDTLTAIQEAAFEQCDKLQSINFPQSLQVIGDDAFYENISLKEVKLPEGLQLLGTGAFAKCTSLETVNVPNVTHLGGAIFAYNKSLRNVVLASGLKEITNLMFENCDKLETITIPSNVKRIGERAFFSCDALQNIHFSTTGVEIIETKAFYHCSSLQSIKLSSTVKSIGERAFSSCVQLREIVLPANLEVIHDYAFSGCENLKKVAASQKLREIRSNAFESCNQLRIFEFPSSLQLIGYRAFYYTALEIIKIPGTVKVISKESFSANNSIKEIVLEEGIEEIGANAFESAIYMEELIIPQSVKVIKEKAFQLCLNLKWIEMGSNVEYVEDNVFTTYPKFKGIIVRDDSKDLETVTYEDWERIVRKLGIHQVIPNGYIRTSAGMKQVKGTDDVIPPTIPFVGSVSDAQTIISGSGEVGATIIAMVGTAQLGSVTVDSEGNFVMRIPKQRADTQIIIIAIDNAKNKSKSVTLVVEDKTAPINPTVYAVSDKDREVKGKTENLATVIVQIGTKVYKTIANPKGEYKVSIPPQIAGTKISVQVQDKVGYKSKPTIVKVLDKTPPVKPTILPVTTKSVSVSGKTEKNTTVYIKVGSKVYKTTANSTGRYNLKISKHKKGTKISVYAQDKAGNKSSMVSVSVK